MREGLDLRVGMGFKDKEIRSLFWGDVNHPTHVPMMAGTTWKSYESLDIENCNIRQLGE